MTSEQEKIQAEKVYFESLFRKYDKDDNGSMDARELAKMLREENIDVSEKIIKKMVRFSDKNNDGKIDMHEFIDMVLDRRFSQLFGRYVKSYVDFLVPPNKRHKFKPIGRRAGVTLDDHNISEVDGSYEKGFSCWPPPLCMVLMSILEIICYIWNEVKWSDNPKMPNENIGPVANYLVYDPFKRQEAWRFLTYMFVHFGWMHLTTNLIVQIVLGTALELRNQWWRVFIVYIAGVIAGSLVTSISDPLVYLGGASGGVYAILTSHLANMIINWSEMSYPVVQLFIFVLLISTDVFTAIHNRYNLGDQTPVGYAAHFGGALAGFLVGIWVLKNVEPTEKEKYLWWAAFLIYILLMGTAVVLNIFWTGHFTAT